MLLTFKLKIFPLEFLEGSKAFAQYESFPLITWSMCAIY